MNLQEMLYRLRGWNWLVAVHNDFNVMDGKVYTFWLFTNTDSGRFVKAEGESDTHCVEQIYDEVRKIEREKFT